MSELRESQWGPSRETQYERCRQWWPMSNFLDVSLDALPSSKQRFVLFIVTMSPSLLVGILDASG